MRRRPGSIGFPETSTSNVVLVVEGGVVVSVVPLVDGPLVFVGGC